jgi:hypothetical protein
MHCTKRLFCLVLGVFAVLSFQFIFVPAKSFANPNDPEILIEQILQDRMFSPSPFSTVGMVILFYTPEQVGYFINILALDKSLSPVWIVRNLYIPNSKNAIDICSLLPVVTWI